MFAELELQRQLVDVQRAIGLFVHIESDSGPVRIGDEAKQSGIAGPAALLPLSRSDAVADFVDFFLCQSGGRASLAGH